MHILDQSNDWECLNSTCFPTLMKAKCAAAPLLTVWEWDLRALVALRGPDLAFFNQQSEDILSK